MSQRSFQFNRSLRVYFFRLLIIMLTGRTCAQLNCDRGNGCCIEEQIGNAYCQVSSICKDDPIWQSAVIPAVLFLLALILIIIACYKICTSRKQTMKVNNFAKKQIRTLPRQSHRRLSTLTSIM